MSWSTRTEGSVAKSAIELDEPTLSDVVEVEQREQFEAAVEAAKILAKAIGRDEDSVIVTLSGHANPEHGPRSGWANEAITVSVSADPSAEPK